MPIKRSPLKYLICFFEKKKKFFSRLAVYLLCFGRSLCKTIAIFNANINLKYFQHFHEFRYIFALHFMKLLFFGRQRKCFHFGGFRKSNKFWRLFQDCSLKVKYCAKDDNITLNPFWAEIFDRGKMWLILLCYLIVFLQIPSLFACHRWFRFGFANKQEIFYDFAKMLSMLIEISCWKIRFCC